MDPRDHPSDLLDGAHCAACGRPVPSGRVRVLARRDDLAFAELPCEECGSISLAIFVGQPHWTREPVAAAPEVASREGFQALGADDVLDMHLFLAGWSGDLHSLVGGPGDSGRAPGVP